jgi:hypothetical protein
VKYEPLEWSRVVGLRDDAYEATGRLASALGVSTADRAYRQLGRGRVAVIATQLADPYNRSLDGRDTTIESAGKLHRSASRP